MVAIKENSVFAERYKCLKQLGCGGYSEVWLAEDCLTGLQVALKIYASNGGLDDDGVAIFTKEFSLVFGMKHQNLLIPNYFDSWDRMPYLILPYCKNGSAFKYVTGSLQIDETECWKLLRDVSDGLAYLHGKNPPVIHQDIKPDNILISEDGFYMITDFGISTKVRSTMRRLHAQESSGGTLAYMGPERFSTTPMPIMASDIWSLGAMLFELMTCGNLPFGADGGLFQKKGADIPYIEGDFSEELKTVVYKCLALNTWDRPTAEQLKNLAEAHLKGASHAGYSVLHEYTSNVKAQEQQCIRETPKEQKIDKGDNYSSKNESNRIVEALLDIIRNKRIWYALLGIIVVAILSIGLLNLGYDEEISQVDPPNENHQIEEFEKICKNEMKRLENLYAKVDSIQTDNSFDTLNVDRNFLYREDYYIEIVNSINQLKSDNLFTKLNDSVKSCLGELTDKSLSNLNILCDSYIDHKKNLESVENRQFSKDEIDSISQRVERIKTITEN